jgi:hypothetical protein
LIVAAADALWRWDGPPAYSHHASAKVTERLWEIGDIADVLEAWEAAN